MRGHGDAGRRRGAVGHGNGVTLGHFGLGTVERTTSTRTSLSVVSAVYMTALAATGGHRAARSVRGPRVLIYGNGFRGLRANLWTCFLISIWVILRACQGVWPGGVTFDRAIHGTVVGRRIDQFLKEGESFNVYLDPLLGKARWSRWTGVGERM